MNSGKLVVIGLDGGTLALLRPWAEEGYLPNIRKFFDEGVAGEMKSTIPPITIPAWASMATGKNPGKLGLFNFITRRDSSYAMKAMTSYDIKGQSFWDYLSAAGLSVGIMGYPMLYPAYPVNGFMVSGFGSGKGGNWTYPNELDEEISSVSPGYVINLGMHHYSDEDKLISDIGSSFESQALAAKHLFEKYNPDCFMFVVSMTDWMQHVFWHYLDPSRKGEGDGRRERLISIYKRIDAFIGEFMDSGRNVIIVSDHGSGPLLYRFNLSRWLKDNGYLSTRDGGTALHEAKRRAYNFLSDIVTAFNLKTHLHSLVKKAAPAVRSRLSPTASQIDFRKSRAYLLDEFSGAVYLNIEGRDKFGFVPAAQVPRLKEEIAAGLSRIPDMLEGIDSIEVHDGSRVYHGENALLAPDLIVEIGHGACGCFSNPSSEPLVEDLRNREFPKFRGSHRMEGIFMAYGPDIRKGVALSGAEIVDVMPTILSMFGLGIPAEVDGKALDIFSEGSGLSKRKPLPPGKIPGKNKLAQLKKMLRKK